MAKVIVGLSGGVDSSVAALLLLKQGYEVEGLFMRNWDSTTNQDFLGNPDFDSDICPQEKDYNDALAVANQLGIKLHRHDFIEEYWDDVFTYFLDEYRRGRTPNPDILCNKYIKFKSFLEVALSYGADYIAMGHYARVIHGEEHMLLRGVDTNKDQSYFLCQLTQEQLSKTLFPVGDIIKPEVRRIALEANLPVAKKKDSTGICFIGERRFSQFLSNYLKNQEGPMKTLSGDIVGQHQGLMYYTIGQRKGLRIGGSKKYDNNPWFVIGKELSTNTLFVGQGIDHPQLFSDECTVEDVNWIPKDRFVGTMDITAKFRYRQADVPVSITWIDEDRIHVQFKELVRAVTPGQACVFYDKDICLGGGTINEVFFENKKRPY
ncbi:MAG: tRNA 2-thiouridine(34) synthase MnmA [Candidatus Izemoplasmatales bacterium]